MIEQWRSGEKQKAIKHVWKEALRDAAANVVIPVVPALMGAGILHLDPLAAYGAVLMTVTIIRIEERVHSMQNSNN